MSKNISKKTKPDTQPITFSSSNERSKWAHDMYNKISFKKATISKTDIIAELKKYSDTTALTQNDLSIVIQICKQLFTESKNKKAQELGYESNLLGLNLSTGLSKQELKYYNIGKCFYKTDVVAQNLTKERTN